jgi:quercetin dioxygenase-like cupin family protein
MTARTLRNPRTGETITFTRTSAETGGELFEMSYRMAPHAAIADEHAHPHQEMIINVLSGTLTCSIDGVEHKIPAGERVVIPAGAFHFQRNDSEEAVHAVEEYRPALQMQEFFEVLIGWANDGKTNETGLPSPLRSAVMHRYFRASIRSRSRRRNVAALLLAPLGRVLGYQREIEQYLRRAALGQ